MKELIQSCIKRGCLIEPELLEMLKTTNPIISDNLIEILLSIQNKKILSKDIFLNNLPRINSFLDTISKSSSDDKKNAIETFKTNFISFSNIEEKSIKQNLITADFKILKSYNLQSKKVTVEDFVKYFKVRMI
jgi:hypothetical protein